MKWQRLSKLVPILNPKIISDSLLLMKTELEALSKNCLDTFKQPYEITRNYFKDDQISR